MVRVDPERFLAGPRARRMCWSLLEGRFAGSFRMEVWTGEAERDPRRVARAVTEAVERPDLERLRGERAPAAFLAALGDAVSSAMYWQEPDATDRTLVDRRVRAALAPVAEAVLSATGTAWWSEPMAQDAQFQVSFGAEPGDPDVAAADPSTSLQRWRAETLADEHAAAERPADPRANWSGRWWSTPAGAGVLGSTRTLGQAGPVGLSLVEDGHEWTAARCRRLHPRATVSVFEVAGPEDLAELVGTYPLPVPRSRRHDWWRTTGEDRAWAIPDYVAVAGDFDAIHLSVLGYLTTAGRAIEIGRSLPAGSTHTVLAGWDPDQTWWLTDGVELDGHWSTWTMADAQDPRSWRPVS